MERLTIRTHGSIADELVEEMGTPIDSVFVKKEMYKDCRHICDKNESCDNCHLYEVMCKLAEYEDAEEQGRLVTLPCKEGDEVYVLRDSIRGKTVLSGKVQNIEIAHRNILVITTLGMFNAREFGKSVFLSEEALAEKVGE